MKPTDPNRPANTAITMLLCALAALFACAIASETAAGKPASIGRLAAYDPTGQFKLLSVNDHVGQFRAADGQVLSIKLHTGTDYDTGGLYTVTGTRVSLGKFCSMNYALHAVTPTNATNAPSTCATPAAAEYTAST